MHAKVVEILEALFGERVSEQADILANHAIAGQQWAKAAHYYRTASRNALSQFACEIAVAHGREALKALDHLPDEVGRKQAAHDIRLELRNALFPLARHTEMLVYLTEAEEYAIALDDLPRQARTAAHLCHCYWLSGDWPNAVAAGRRALAMAEPVGGVAIIVWARFFKALAHYSSGELGDAISLLRTNVATLDGDRRVSRFGGFSLPFVVGADWLGCCLSEQGEFGLALEYAEAGLHVAESAGYPFDSYMVCSASAALSCAAQSERQYPSLNRHFHIATRPELSLFARVFWRCSPGHVVSRVKFQRRLSWASVRTVKQVVTAHCDCSACDGSPRCSLLLAVQRKRWRTRKVY